MKCPNSPHYEDKHEHRTKDFLRAPADLESVGRGGSTTITFVAKQLNHGWSLPTKQSGWALGIHLPEEQHTSYKTFTLRRENVTAPVSWSAAIRGTGDVSIVSRARKNSIFLPAGKNIPTIYSRLLRSMRWLTIP